MSIHFESMTRDFLNPWHIPAAVQFREIPACLVRKDHSCGKFLGASKSCFIACPATDEVEPILALIQEKLEKIGIEQVIAIKKRAYGQDIFCTKICGKIIESQFCVVILDDIVRAGDGGQINISNPNVYYEYGLMTALNKHVIPLQKEAQGLAFNIQTHDTIKYTPRNISVELDRALKDAVKTTQENRASNEGASTASERLIRRCLEMNGYQRKDARWFLSDDIEDTVFDGYGHVQRAEYLFFTVLDDKILLQNALTDMPVIIRRLESRLSELSEKLADQTRRVESLGNESPKSSKAQETTDARQERPLLSSTFRERRALEQASKDREGTSSRIELIRNSRFVVVLTPQVVELKDKFIAQYDNTERVDLHLPLHVGDISGVQIGDLGIPFKGPTL